MTLHISKQTDSQSRDETRNADGSLGESWQYVMGSLQSLGTDEISERQKKALRILRDDGATYTIYDQPGRDQTWPLDLIPWLIDSNEWHDIEAGLQERAELFNLILTDLYGKRELITRGILPPELVFGNNAFLRACDGIKLVGDHQLIIHAADMMRAPDGTMRVLADRTQAPSGAGYALENRTVMNRVLPSLFRDSHVHRLAGYFQSLRQKLVSLAPDVSRPEIAVLTPGAYNETYFEHAYLANYLGFKLVQSSDLSVRNGFVWMKSLSGLTRVDVILRRVDDYFCDQVELKGDSQLGIPGLLQVIRLGNVAVANPLGSGILENPALLRYLPAVSQHFLGRELRLATVKTWWCGDPQDLAYVLQNLDKSVIKRVFRAPQTSSNVVSGLDEKQRKALIERIKENPEGYVAQEKLAPSHMPVFDAEQLSNRPALLRTYAVASDGSYRVMPGGLTRVGVNPQAPMISNQLGSISKDTWIIASEPEKQTTLLPQDAAQETFTASEALPSRVVDNLFWMGRYAERTENVLRLIRSVFLQLNGAITLTDHAHDQLLTTITQFTMTYPGFIDDTDRRTSPEEELLAVIVDPSKSGSVAHCIQSMMACADESRDLLSTDTQRIINDIKDQMTALAGTLPRTLLSAPEEMLNSLVSSMLALSGIVQESMVRGMGWQFFDTGRRLERASQTVSMLQVSLVEPQAPTDEEVTLETLLMTFEGLMTYRRHNQGYININNALTLVLQDSLNPRSLIYQLNKLQEHLNHLPSDSPGNVLETEARNILEAISLVSLADVSKLTTTDKTTGRRANLEQILTRTRFLVNDISDQLSTRYFTPSPGPSQLIEQKQSQ